MIVRNNKRLTRRIEKCERCSSFARVNFDWSKCKTVHMKVIPAHVAVKRNGKRLVVPKQTLFSPGRY